MSLGIYSNNFLFEYNNKAKEFECFNCKLVSPNNYFLECKHCICQKCVKIFKKCPIDNFRIILNEKHPTAFHFTIIDELLNHFIMKCIFDECDFVGKYKEFIRKHFHECKYRKERQLLSEYFKTNKTNKKEKTKKNKKLVNIFTEKKNHKNKYLKKNKNNFQNEVIDEENEKNEEDKTDKNENYIILDGSSEENNEIDHYSQNNSENKEKFIDLENYIQEKIEKSFNGNNIDGNRKKENFNEINEFCDYNSDGEFIEIGKKRKRRKKDEEIFLNLPNSL